MNQNILFDFHDSDFNIRINTDGTKSIGSRKQRLLICDPHPYNFILCFQFTQNFVNLAIKNFNLPATTVTDSPLADNNNNSNKNNKKNNNNDYNNNNDSSQQLASLFGDVGDFIDPAMLASLPPLLAFLFRYGSAEFTHFIQKDIAHMLGRYCKDPTVFDGESDFPFTTVMREIREQIYQRQLPHQQTSQLNLGRSMGTGVGMGMGMGIGAMSLQCARGEGELLRTVDVAKGFAMVAILVRNLIDISRLLPEYQEMMASVIDGVLKDFLKVITEDYYESILFTGKIFQKQPRCQTLVSHEISIMPAVKAIVEKYAHWKNLRRYKRNVCICTYVYILIQFNLYLACIYVYICRYVCFYVYVYVYYYYHDYYYIYIYMYVYIVMSICKR